MCGGLWVCAGAYVYVGVHAHVCVEAGEQPQVSSLGMPSTSFKRGLLIGLELSS